jgi:hypothetical protein
VLERSGDDPLLSFFDGPFLSIDDDVLVPKRYFLLSSNAVVENDRSAPVSLDFVIYPSSWHSRPRSLRDSLRTRDENSIGKNNEVAKKRSDTVIPQDLNTRSIHAHD